MSLRTSIEIVLEEYPAATEATFKENPAAQFLRDEFPKQVTEALGENPLYSIEGSAGKGVWTKVPWLAVFNITVTTSAQEGYYLVYLFREDFSGVYLSLNQGITTIKEQYGSESKVALRARAADFRARLGKSISTYDTGPLDLTTSGASSLGAFYEHGNVCSKFYERNELPSETILANDLREFLHLYELLVVSELKVSRTSSDEAESNLGLEQLLLLREHKRLERNATLARKAKKIHGYKCQACDFDFERVYGEIGKEFIEAHHLTPLSELRGKIVQLDARKDFCVLCANCHRMIHKSPFTNDILAFKRTHFGRTLL